MEGPHNYSETCLFLFVYTLVHVCACVRVCLHCESLFEYFTKRKPNSSPASGVVCFLSNSTDAAQ